MNLHTLVVELPSDPHSVLLVCVTTVDEARHVGAIDNPHVGIHSGYNGAHKLVCQPLRFDSVPTHRDTHFPFRILRS
jgi:hypothetical protein